ncbi:hypothetical protein M8C21_010984, partial [Ambrosia artemisiifolia]
VLIFAENLYGFEDDFAYINGLDFKSGSGFVDDVFEGSDSLEALAVLEPLFLMWPIRCESQYVSGLHSSKSC